MDRQTDGWTERQKDRKTERQKDRKTERQKDRQKERKTERQKDRKTERQTDRSQKDTHLQCNRWMQMNKQTDRTNRLTVKPWYVQPHNLVFLTGLTIGLVVLTLLTARVRGQDVDDAAGDDRDARKVTDEHSGQVSKS